MNTRKENQKKIQLITKEKIKHYLKEYPYLSSKIRKLELNHIKYGPTLDEFRQNINTVENQVIAMEEDSKLQEMKFYKQSISKYLFDDEIIEYLYLHIKKEAENHG